MQAPNYKLSHIGYFVKDINKSYNRFIQTGAKIIIPPTIESLQKVMIALLSIEDNVKIELISPLAGCDHPLQTRLRQSGNCLDHLCYQVENIDKALEYENHIKSTVICPKSPAVAFKNHQLAFVFRKTGLIVELIEEIKDESWK